MQPARGIDDDRVESLGPRFGQRARRARHRIHRLRRVHANLGLLAQHRELLDCGGPPHVGRHHQRMASLPDRATSPAFRTSSSCPSPAVRAAGPRAASARRLREPAFGIAEQRQQLVADDLDDLLARRQAPQDRLVHRAIADAVDERLDDLEVDVGFEQRQPNLAQRRLDVVRRQPHFAAQRLEDVLDAGAERLEHRTGIGGLAPQMALTPMAQTLILGAGTWRDR